MKRVLLLLCLLSVSNLIYGQETTQKTNSLTSAVFEKFSVLKADKKIKHGTYIATVNGKVAAQGNYKEGKRAGYWSFYNNNGDLVQTYNYNKNFLIFNDTADVKPLNYFFSETTVEGDTISPPVKLGGVYYGLMSIINEQKAFKKQLNDEFVLNSNPPMQKIVKYDFSCNHIFTIDAEGNLSKHEVMVAYGNIKKIYTLTDGEFDDEFKRFMPGTINHKPVECKITISNPIQITMRGYVKVTKSSSAF